MLALVPWNQAGAIRQLSGSLCKSPPVSFLQATCPLYKTCHHDGTTRRSLVPIPTVPVTLPGGKDTLLESWTGLFRVKQRPKSSLLSLALTAYYVSGLVLTVCQAPH